MLVLYLQRNKYIIYLFKSFYILFAISGGMQMHIWGVGPIIGRIAMDTLKVHGLCLSRPTATTHLYL